MSIFIPGEIEYLRGQPLGRLATVNAAGEPHVVPVSFCHNAELGTIDIGGHNLSRSKKFRDVAQNGRASFVVDDVLPPWRARGIEVRGRAEALVEGGRQVNADFDSELIRITPTRVVAWGIDTDAYRPNSRSVDVPEGSGAP